MICFGKFVAKRGCVQGRSGSWIVQVFSGGVRLLSVDSAVLVSELSLCNVAGLDDTVSVLDAALQPPFVSLRLSTGSVLLLIERNSKLETLHFVRLQVNRTRILLLLF